MVKKIALGAGVVALIVVFVLVLGQIGKSASKAPSVVGGIQVPGVTTPSKPAGVKGTLRDLLAAGKAVSCKVSYGGQTGTQGVVYVSGKKVRVDFTSKDYKGNEIPGHMIQDETYAYVWGATGAIGTKIRVDLMAKAGSGDQNPGAVLDQQTEMTGCGAWKVDNAVFVPPTNVKFTDLSEKVKGMQTSEPSEPSEPSDSVVTEE